MLSSSSNLVLSHFTYTYNNWYILSRLVGMSFNDEKDSQNNIVYWSLRLGFEKSQNAYHTFYFFKRLYCFCPGSNWGPCACEAHVIPIHHKSSVSCQFQWIIFWNMLKLLIYHVALMFTQALLSELSRWSSILAIIA